ncbi:MAG TPA: ABC transporter substrate-binding protein [Dehalococcoidia bacterium]|nr:ABC transporter substrate-binding protein [Dehalococcoidia bacterium]
MERYQPVLGRLRRYGRRQVLRGSVGVMAGSAGAWLLACSGSNNNARQPAQTATTGGASPAPAGAASAAASAAAKAATAAPKRGGRLKQAYVNSTQSLNPVTDSGQRLSLGAMHVWDRLISTRLNKDTAKEYVLEAAQSVELTDPTTVIFKLKPGMTYHNRAPVDGRAVEADDVVKSEIYVRDEKRAGNNAFQTGSMDSVTAPDTQTVVFKLKGPNAYLFSGTQLADPGAQCIFPRELIGNLDMAWSVGSGPYEMVDYQMNVHYLYRRFAGYHEASKGLPYIDEREFTVITDSAAQEAAFRSEQIHLWLIPVNNMLDPVKRDLGSKIEIDQYLGLSMQTINANVTRPPWNDARVREALYRVANRQQYLDLIQGGEGVVPPGPMPAGLADYQLDPKDTQKYFQQDPKAAKQLLDAAGFDFNHEIEISTIDTPQNDQGCQILQQQLSQAGVKSKVLPMPLAEWLQGKIVTGNWDTFVAYWPGYDSPQVPLRLQATETRHVHKYAGLKDPAIDKLIDQSEITLDKDARIKLVKDIQIALLEKYTPMIYTQNTTTYQPRWKYVRDYEVTPATIPMYRVEMWLNQ